MKLNKKKSFKINFISQYFRNIEYIFHKIDYSKMLKISNFLEKIIQENKTIFVAGNGGSAAIGNHLLCDFNKGIKMSSRNSLKPKIISLVNSMEIITAISNDISYEKIFTFQLDNYYRPGDCLICFSVSGQSKNIIDVIKFANKKGIKTILFQGFGNLNKKIKPEYYINLKYQNYGATEDIFQSFMHAISQNIRIKFKKKGEIL